VAEDSSCVVHELPLESVSDPTDFQQILPAFRSAVVESIRRWEENRVPVFVNVSSGTPTMQTALLLLIERLMPTAVALQVREGRWLTAEEPRVRRVTIPTL